MSTYLYSYIPTPEPIDPEFPEPPNHAPQANSSYVGELDNGNYVHLLPNEDAEANLIGWWDNDGTLHSVDGAFDQLRDLGNDAGVATNPIDVSHYQGHLQRQVQASPVEGSLPYYPANEQPFTLRITRTLTTDDAWPHIPWGWTVAVFSQDPARDILARAIGVYNEDGNYLYTTGAFVLMDFEEGVDEEGSPIIVQRYGTVCPIGQRTAEAEPVYFKLLLGSAPEGAWTLTDLEEGAEQTKLFWEHDQPAIPEPL